MTTLLSHGVPLYVLEGVCVALTFVLVGFDRIDPAAKGAIAARVLLLPSLVLLWPVVVVRWTYLALMRR